MMRKPILSLLITSISFVFAQVSLPNPPYLPPNATFGTQPSNFSGITPTNPNPHWPSLLGNLLWFYEAQRSGKLPSTNRVPWRNSSTVDDGRDVDLDLSGGYYDAGDYVKYTFPLSFSLMSICWGAIDFGSGYDTGNQTAYLDDMLRWGLDWLIKAHPSPDQLFVQVGDSDLDNAYWGGDQGIPTPRTSYQINSTSPGTDAAAQASAAFSACSALYANHTLSSSSSPASLKNISYASTLLTHAQQLYAFATNTSGHDQQVYQKAVPSVADAYPSSDFNDELVIAGLFLSVASNSSDAYAQAAQLYQQANLRDQLKPGDDQVFNWDSKAPGAVVLGAQISRMYPDLVAGTQNDANWTSDAETYFDAIVNSTGRSHLTNGGLLVYPGDSDTESLNPALNAAMLLTRYASTMPLSSSNRTSTYLSFARSQFDYVMGKNPMTVPYVVGTHPNSPQNPHSALATGASPQDIANIDTVPEFEHYILYGAVVGGPDFDDKFWDRRSDWVQGEVALDYNAPLLTLIAYTLTNSSLATQDPWYTSLTAGSYDEVRPGGDPCDAAIKTGCSASGLDEGSKIAMGIVITIVGLVLLGFAGYWGYVWRKEGGRGGLPSYTASAAPALKAP